MVNKQELQEALSQQSDQIKVQLEQVKMQLDESVSKIRKEIIDTLSTENKKLHDKISLLEVKIIDMEKKAEVNLQYQRFSSVVISGIPLQIEHSELEGIVITLFNKICHYKITIRDIVAVHRISKTSPRVLVKFVNRRDATSLLDGKVALNNLINDDIGLGHCDKFYVEDHLTPYVSNLAYRCRCLKRSDKIVKTKVSRGTVKILKAAEDGTLKWHDILHADDINNHFPLLDREV